jgi:hypothetical protein
MTGSSNDRYSAGEQALGYIYQARLALLKLLASPESTSVFIEKDDDLDFESVDGRRTLASLKHKAVGDRLNNLSTDFWKSVRIWLARYERDAKTQSNLRFLLFTTGTVADDSVLQYFLPDSPADKTPEILLTRISEALTKSKADLSTKITDALSKMKDEEKEDFFSRIEILDDSPRITDVPSIIKDLHMRTIRRDCRDALFERLEGWWNDCVIRLLSEKRTAPLSGYEVSDKLNLLADEYKSDNLPITFRGKTPPWTIDTDGDDRLFVLQLREIGISSNRLRNAILDYYRAFEQRSAWARENLLVPDEMEGYEDRLVDEWSRYKDVIFERLDNSADEVLLQAGQALYDWADLQSSNIAALRIRERVTEPYVIRGGFHILANLQPPRVYWHPRFLSRIAALLGTCA